MLSRRHLLGNFLRALAAAHFAAPAVAAPAWPAVTPRDLAFPGDHGAHPEYRTEWWYLTGWLDRAGNGGPLGFQVTFFRVRPGIAEDNPSRFATRQLLLAHAAIADPARGALLHDKRMARAGFGVVDAGTADTDVRLERWTLRRDPATGAYRAVIPARGFELVLDATPTGPLLLQGEGGYSRKGPLPAQASYYYSQPALKLRATVARDGSNESATGIGWLDHEWSSSVLAPEAAGWDWMGMNLDDGSALTAFQIRRRDGGPVLHTYASLRPAGAAAGTFGRGDVAFRPLGQWTSPRTRATWPVAQELRVGNRVFTTQPLFQDQELDSRLTTGAVYWEGASLLLEGGRPVGRGYLELTGYLEPLRL